MKYFKQLAQWDFYFGEIQVLIRVTTAFGNTFYFIFNISILVMTLIRMFQYYFNLVSSQIITGWINDVKNPDPKDVVVLVYKKVLLCQLPQKSLSLPACLIKG